LDSWWAHSEHTKTILSLIFDLVHWWFDLHSNHADIYITVHCTW
jgi:hypothetical protein